MTSEVCRLSVACGLRGPGTIRERCLLSRSSTVRVSRTTLRFLATRNTKRHKKLQRIPTRIFVPLRAFCGQQRTGSKGVASEFNVSVQRSARSGRCLLSRSSTVRVSRTTLRFLATRNTKRHKKLQRIPTRIFVPLRAFCGQQRTGSKGVASEFNVSVQNSAWVERLLHLSHRVRHRACDEWL